MNINLGTKFLFFASESWSSKLSSCSETASARQRDFCFARNQGNNSPSNIAFSQREKVTYAAISKKNKTKKRVVGFWKNPALLVLPCNATRCRDAFRRCHLSGCSAKQFSHFQLFILFFPVLA